MNETGGKDVLRPGNPTESLDATQADLLTKREAAIRFIRDHKKLTSVASIIGSSVFLPINALTRIIFGSGFIVTAVEQLRQARKK